MSIWTPTRIKELDGPLDPKHVATRNQANTTLSYITAWHAIAEANRIFGFGEWNRETVSMTETSRELVDVKGYNGKPDYKQWRVSYVAKVRVTVDGAIREGTGFGSGMGKPNAIGDAIEGAVKEAESDAMKRALMTFGNKFGLALYDKTQANVRVDDGRLTNAKARPVATAINKDIDGSQTVEELDAKWKVLENDCLSSLPQSWEAAAIEKYETKREALKEAQV